MEKLKNFYHRSLNKCSSYIKTYWRYIAWGYVGYLTFFILIMGYFFYTGAGKWFDILFTIGTAALGFIIGMLLTVFILKIAAGLPRLFIGLAIGSIIAVKSAGSLLGPFFRMMGMSIIFLGAFIGLTYLFYKKRKKYYFLIFSSITLILHGVFFYVIFNDGKEGEWSLELLEEQGESYLSNPAALGDFSYHSFTYGSGEDKRREEYREVEFKTETVNVSPFIVRPKGINSWYREWFWGFDLTQAPINGRVWMPKEAREGPLPLVLMVHGNHNMVDFSDGGYAYLGELLASKGYIAVSVDENFLNSGKSGHVGWDNAGRAWMLLKHLEQWDKWNRDKNNSLHNMVDMSNIALIGHSRGGEAVSIAALFNELDRFPNNAKLRLHFNFSIKSLIGLSPGDGRFKPGDQPVELRNINYLTLQGGNDADHTNYLGIRQFERVTFTEDFDGFKSSIYIYGANHGQFNSDWEVDQPSPYWWFMNRKEIMEPELQREMTKLYIAAFLDATLKGKKEYKEIFISKETASSWIPIDPIRLKFEDSRFTPIATFEEDVDVTSLSVDGGSIDANNLHVWKEANLILRNKEPQGNRAVKLGWRSKNARYSIKLPSNESEKLSPSSILSLDAVQLHPDRYKFYGIPIPGGDENRAIPITVIIKPTGVTKMDSRIRKTVEIEPTYSSKLYKFDWWNERFGNKYEHMLQTYRIPINFLEENFPDLEYSEIDEIIFEFNHTKSGLIFVDNIGFTN